ISNGCVKINSCNAKDYQLERRQSNDDNAKKKRRKQSKSSSSLNCSKFTSNKTRNKRVKQNEADERSTTALNLILTQTNDDDNDDNYNNNDDDDDDREILNQDAIWKFDSANVTAALSPSFTSSTAIIDRYEKLIEIFGSDKVYGDKSKNYISSIIIVTLLRQSPQMV
ncbi:hypothetical protein WUBG_15855, partial [Wuchereria bancrofti]